MLFNATTLTTIFVTFLSASLLAMDDLEINYRQAKNDDIEALFALTNKYSINDSDKIVIVPKLFRKDALTDNIGMGKIFVAYKTDKNNNETKLLAFKKLYLMKNQDDITNTLNNEIRCTNEKKQLLKTSYIKTTQPNAIQKKSLSEIEYNENNAYIYNGGDFTHPKYRGHTINKCLMNTALALIKKQTSKYTQDNTCTNLMMIYGLTNINAGEGESGFDRTPSIVKSFIPFALEIQYEVYPDEPKSSDVEFRAYQAFMPTFNPDAQVCVPESDDQSKPGYGNVLSYKLCNQNK